MRAVEPVDLRLARRQPMSALSHLHEAQSRGSALERRRKGEGVLCPCCGVVRRRESEQPMGAAARAIVEIDVPHEVAKRPATIGRRHRADARLHRDCTYTSSIEILIGSDALGKIRGVNWVLLLPDLP